MTPEMKILRALSIVASCLMLAAGASAQISLTPPGAEPPAADWYKRAADGGDREGMFALAMLRLGGRGGPVNREEAVKWLASAAKLGNPKAAYNLALLYLDGQTLPQDLKRAAELLRVAADAGNPEAQYALPTFH